jgi:hypothetical protein
LQNGAEYSETSAKNGDGIQQMCEIALNKYLDQSAQMIQAQNDNFCSKTFKWKNHLNAVNNYFMFMC